MPDTPVASPLATAAPSNSPFEQPVNPEAQRLASQPPKEVVRVEAPKPVTPGSKAWAEMSPNQRAEQSRAANDKMQGIGDPATTVQVRGEHGEIIFKDRTTGKVIDAGGTANPDAPVIEPAATGEKFKVGEFEVTEQEVRDLMADKAARDLARTQIPADPKGYELKLPEGVKLPGDAQINFKSDPESVAMIEAAQSWAHKKGLSQAEFSELLSIQAHSVAAHEQKIASYALAEVEKLGAAGPQRIDALTTWIRSQVGDVDARPIIATMATAAHVRFFEKMQQKIMNQGGSSFTQSHRVDEPTGPDEATYNSWSYSQKKAYAERASSPGNRR